MLEIDYKECKSIDSLYEKYRVSVIGRRCFRQWIGDRLITDTKTSKEIIDILKQEGKSELKNETMTAILQSDNVRAFFNDNKTMLIENNMEVLKEFLFWMPISCVFISKDDLINSSSVTIVPNGECWEAIISIVYDLGIGNWYRLYHRILPILLLWSKANETGETTQKCGKMALTLLEGRQDNDNRLLFYKIIPVLFRSVSEIGSGVENLIRDVLAKDRIEGSSIDKELLKFVVKENDIGNFRLSKYSPQLVMDLWDYCWRGGHLDEGFAIGQYAAYGLDRSFTVLMGGGWTETSMPYSLLASSKFAEEFIPNFLNQCVSCYINNLGENHHLSKVTFQIGGVKIEQWGDEVLWCAYRNRVTYNLPELMVSLLMALQWYLDIRLKHGIIECRNLVELIRKSNNVSVTAVVTSVVLKHLDMCRQLADELSESEKLLRLDWHRWATEYDSYEVHAHTGVNISVSFIERERMLKLNSHLCQSISLANYKKAHISPPSLPLESNLDSSSMAPLKWALQVFDGQENNIDEALLHLIKARESFEQYQEMGIMSKLSFSYADGVAPAYIKLCESVDDNAIWCKDLIIEILRESDKHYSPAAIYDGVGYCVSVIPKLLSLFPEQQRNILDAVLQLSLNIRERANMRPLDECLVDMIREGGLWVYYKDEMKSFITQYISLCKERSGRLLPKEISLALRMLPRDDYGLKMKWLRAKLAGYLLKCDDNDLNQGRLTVRQLSVPIAEILVHRKYSLVGMYIYSLLEQKLTRRKVSEAYLHGLLYVGAESNGIGAFFSIWKRLARKVFGCRKQNNYDIIRLKNILTFQESNDLLSEIAKYDEFCEECFDYMDMLVSKYPTDAEIIKGIMVMMDYAKPEKKKDWLALLHKALYKTNASVINYVGLTWMEHVMRDCQNTLSLGLSENAVQREQFLGVLEKMIECGSSRAYAMKEYL